MKTNFFLFVIILVVVLSACKKNDSSQQTINQPPFSYIKSISVSDTSGTLRLVNTLEYDSLHRLKKISGIQFGSFSDTIYVTNTLTYYTSRVLLRETISTSTQHSFTITYYLNSSGLADSSIYVSTISPTDSTYYRYGYTYNPNDQRATEIVKSPDSIYGTISYHYANMNVDYLTANPSSTNSKQLFFYDLGHFNTLAYENAGIKFLGKSCFNALVKVRSEDLNLDMANYSYEYDQSNRISKLVVDGGSITPGMDFFTVPLIMFHEVIVYTYY